MFTKIKPSTDTELWLVIVVFFAYAVGTLTLQHYLPSQIDFIPNIIVVGLLCIGMALLLTRIKIKTVGLDSIFWLLLFLLVLVQPFFLSYDYLDNLIFPLATLLACFILSVIINNVIDKSRILQYSAYALIAIGMLNALVQLIQYLNVPFLSLFIMPVQASDIRFYGNVAQPNQLAFIYALAIVACHFIYQQSEINLRTLMLFLLFTFTAGIALSSSRGGLILALASLLFYIISCKSLIGFIKNLVPTALTMLSGYLFGLYLLDIYTMPTAANAVSRMTEGSLHLRVELIQQAWVQFQHHPIIGVGLGNLLADSIHHVDELEWFVFSIHSHNLVTQVAAELGIIGLMLLLLPVYIIVKGYWQARTIEMSFVLVCLLIIGLYSFSEYPLWFTRFLILAVFFLSIINTKKVVVNIKTNFLFGLLCMLLATGSGYYYYQYQSYSRANSFLINYDYTNLENMSAEEKQEFADIQVGMVTDLAPIFGFSDYKELYIYYLLPEDNNQLTERIALGNRVITKFLTPTVLLKQALYLGLDNQQSESLQLFKSACVLNHNEKCDEVTKYLSELTNQYEQFYDINRSYNIWKLKNDVQP